MERFGALLIVFGVGSGIAQTIGYELRLLFWVENWGPGPAWMIRGALVVAGLLLIIIGQRSTPVAQGANFPGQPTFGQPGQPGFSPAAQPGFGPQGQSGFGPAGQPGFGPQGQPGFSPPPGQQGFPQGQQGFPPGQQAFPQGQPPPPGPRGLPWIPQDDGTAVIPGPNGIGLQFTPKTPDGGPPPSGSA